MGGDWNEPRDKGPEIEERERRWPKKKKGKKKYTIEYMRHPDPNAHLTWARKGFSWKVYSRYHTARARDDAFQNIVRKHKDHYLNYYRQMQFRKGDP